AFLEYAAPMYHDDALRAHVDTVLNAKETLASAIAKRVTAIYKDQLQELADNPDRITAAQEAYRQQLMQTLRSAYDIETIVQLDATVSEAEALIPAETTDSLAPRMFGQPVVKSNGQQSETAPKFTLSAAKIPLAEPNYLTFFYNTLEPGVDELAEHDLILKIDSLEFNIHPRADMDNMHDSVWLKFIVPLDEYDLEHFAIPIPLRDFPDSPALIYQKAGLDKDAISLDHIREWAYTFVYERRSEAQDSIRTRLDFTGAKADSPPTATEKALFDELAKFLDLAEQNRTLFEELERFINQPVRVPDDMITRVSNFVTHVAAVANAWGSWTPPTGDYADRNPSYEIEELEVADEIHITLTSLKDAPAENPLLQVTGYKLETRDDSDATYTHRFVPDLTDTTPELGSSLLPDRKLTIDNLDIINHQQAQAEIWILRNDEFVEGKKTNPAFVYRTPIIEFSHALVPHLESSIKHNIAEIGSPGDPQTRTLEEHLEKLFKIVIPQEPQQPFGIQLEARYVYGLVDLEGVEYDLTATLPAVFGTPLLDLDDDAGAEKYWDALNLYRANFCAALRDWYDKRKPAIIGGRWVFTFSIYSGKGDSLPLLKIDYLYLQLEHIS
ncbi:MAG: hypothetical protein K8I82_02745, partial [Anaerolineae bacterium]|nr:hypothetical protein [Anaerolineae bacterium]